MGDSETEANGRAPLDMQKLNQTFMENADIIKRILEAFKDSFDDFEGQFRDAAQAGDTELMSRLAHSLKGSAGNIRADQVAELAAELQHQIDDGAGGSDISDSVDGLLDSLDELNDFIDDFTS